MLEFPALATAMKPAKLSAIPLGSHRLSTPTSLTCVNTTLGLGVIEPFPPKVPAPNSTIDPEQLLTLSCSLVNHMLPLASKRIPQGFLMVSSPPALVVLSLVIGEIVVIPFAA